MCCGRRASFLLGEMSSRCPQVRGASGRFLSRTPLYARPLGKPSKMVDFRCSPMSRASGVIGYGRLRSASGGFPSWRASRPIPASSRASGGGFRASTPSRASGGGLRASTPSRASGGGLRARHSSRASGGCLRAGGIPVEICMICASSSTVSANVLINLVQTNSFHISFSLRFLLACSHCRFVM